ncbi:FMN-dependent oxidoreductase (nitrilotriacetate monooxygenase family) [Duganella sp. 1411]|jgi:FMN-dependent oxidoreductase (nitrilotriacetate monooxygenase family)|uniref:LLM class flavin-dependent oxidoreductase n=1 Tax=Duganella sp. 1411 TaxID=2806572 RepID=UPI001AE14F85|nr:LLM class flavin-dependent oxidoreductase [Duganella sp. 1411]MBP1206353.1 FMN-dependent oxidoreductase (nitrilotriacetate monooxygenase family) [Duganella sp. 1411]
MTRQLSIAAFMMRHGHHVAAWRHPQTDLESNPFKVFRRQVQSAERACLDAVFFADSLALTGGVPALEPLTLLSALAACTGKIGLIGTATTTYNEPYTVARQFASLDQISDGRAGWNLVTSDNAAEAANFGRDRHVAHAARYERAREFHQVVTGLWDSWEDGALINDKAGGQLIDPARLRKLNHRGPHFAVAGPLNVSRSPQGRPVVVQAGGSEAGRELAAATAEVVFTAQPSLAKARDFYRDMKRRVVAYGRAPASLKVMPGLFAVVGESQGEADDKFGQLQQLIEPKAGLALLGRMIGNFDLSGYPLDGPLPELPPTQDGQRSRQQLLTDLAQGENLTIRQLYERIAGGRGHFTVVGTAAAVADQMQAWFEQEAADGFNFMAPALPGGLDDFLSLVVPELQRRGLFRTAYQGTTLREHLGLNASDKSC